MENVEELLAGEELGVDAHGAQLAENLRSSDVLMSSYLLEIVERVVEFVAIDVVNLHTRRAWTDEGFVDKDVARAICETSHFRIGAVVVWRVPLINRTKRVFDLPTFGIKELTIRRGEKNFAANALGRHLSGAWINACVTRGSTAQ